MNGNNRPMNSHTTMAGGNSLSLEELFITNAGNGGDGSIIRLDHPRPGVHRSRNEYVDVSRRNVPKRPSTTDRPIGHSIRHQSSGLQSSIRAHSMPLSSTNIICTSTNRPLLSNNQLDRLKWTDLSKPSTSSQGGMRNGAILLPTSTSVITSQPRAANSKHSRSPDSPDCSSESLMCKYCGRCRCWACTTPRTLPTRWIWNNSCLLSNRSMLDLASCVCCLKGCMYHAGLNRNYSEDFTKSASNNLRSCTPVGRDCFLKWTILGWAAVCLPCLWCYFPLKLCGRLLEYSYSKYHDHGCRCNGDRNWIRSRANSTDDQGKRRLKRKRSHTLPPELPSVAAAKAAAAASCSNTSACSSSEYA